LFFVDFIGHHEDEVVQDILKEIEDNTYYLKILGSYPEF
jgi:prephenate dehydratase